MNKEVNSDKLNKLIEKELQLFIKGIQQAIIKEKKVELIKEINKFIYNKGEYGFEFIVAESMTLETLERKVSEILKKKVEEVMK